MLQVDGQVLRYWLPSCAPLTVHLPAPQHQGTSPASRLAWANSLPAANESLKSSRPSSTPASVAQAHEQGYAGEFSHRAGSVAAHMHANKAPAMPREAQQGAPAILAQGRPPASPDHSPSAALASLSSASRRCSTACSFC